MYEIETVRLCIDQPRLGYVSEDVMPVDELREFAARVAVAASVCDSLIRTHQDTGTVDVEHLNPGEKTVPVLPREGHLPSVAQPCTDHRGRRLRGSG